MASEAWGRDPYSDKGDKSGLDRPVLGLATWTRLLGAVAA